MRGSSWCEILPLWPFHAGKFRAKMGSATESSPGWQLTATGGQLSTPRKQTKHPGVSSAGWCQERSCAGSRSSDRVRPWARRNDAWIIEDDYLSELPLKGRAAPALASLDFGGRVLHIGSFSKTISPALRLGFLVVPPELARQFDPP